jgi:hypothetical protein
MSWVKLDDGFAEHPKVIAAGPLAGWVHVCGLCYCNRNLTDGYVPRNVARRLADFEHIGLETGGVPGMVAVGVDVDCEMLVEALVEVGMWEEVEGGYLIHDYLDYNPSKDDVLARREALSKARSEAGKKGALARWQTDGKDGLDKGLNGNRDSNEMAKASQVEWQNDGPDPSLTPPVSTTAEEVSSKEARTSSREDSELREDRGPLPFSNLEPAAELEISKLIALTTGKDERSKDVIRRYAERLPLGSIVKVRESTKGKPAGYVVGALKSELRELEERRTA